MKILLPIHLYLPQHGAGGEAYMHNMAKYLITQGHEVRVLLKQAHIYDIKHLYTYEGVEVFPGHKDEEWHFRWCDIVISHLGFAYFGLHMARLYKKPYVFVAHNHYFDEYVDIYEPPIQWPTNIIFNSQWIADLIKTDQRSMILHPMTDLDKWKYTARKDAQYITLVNCNENKGGKIFTSICSVQTERSFLAVVGGYEEQFIPDYQNVCVQPNTPAMQSIYKATRIILIPSKYESWGMVAAEAMACGIPVICTKTPGLIENCGEAAIYIEDREDINEWVMAIKKLDNPKTYKKYSNLVRARAEYNNAGKELDALNNFLYEATQQTFS